MICIIKYIDEVEFFESLSHASDKLRAKVLKTLLSIERMGLIVVDIDSLKDGLFEIRVKHDSNIFRVIFFCDHVQRSCIVVTHGFVKKSQKIPRRELLKARKRYKEYKEGYISENSDTKNA